MRICLFGDILGRHGFVIQHVTIDAMFEEPFSGGSMFTMHGPVERIVPFFVGEVHVCLAVHHQHLEIRRKGAHIRGPHERGTSLGVTHVHVGMMEEEKEAGVGEP